MRCGKCKSDGVTVDHVRACYQGKQVAVATMSKTDEETLAARALRNLSGEVAKEGNAPMWPASDKQMDYVLDVLQKDRRLPVEYQVRTRDDLERLERDEVSSLITMLKSFPLKNVEGKVTEWTMPAGRYALHWEKDGWSFYQVNKPITGRWKGYTFIVRLIGAPGDYRQVQMGRRDREEALAAIQEDPKAAAVDFGRETKTCFRCHSPLTDPDSIARSMGPICAGKVGW